MHPVNTEPLSLQASKVASNRLVSSNVQATNAVAWWLEALSRQCRKMQLSKCAPFVRTSVRSTSTNMTPT